MTERAVDLKQWPDDSWTLEVPMENGNTVQMWLGKLDKEQAIRETFRRGYRNVRCWNKDVVTAMIDGTLTSIEGDKNDLSR